MRHRGLFAALFGQKKGDTQRIEIVFDRNLGNN